MNPRKRWIFTPQDPKLIQQLSLDLKLSPLLIQILLNRGLSTAEDIQNYLNPELSKLADPFLMKDMAKAVQHIEDALEQKLKITVYGDYDVDGTTGATLLYLLLKDLGANVDVYIPHRVQEGYGLNFKALENLRDQKTDLVITVDNGISSVEEAKRAQELGLKLIIIDHHQVPPQIPMAMAVLNPKQSDCQYPYKELSGVGVAFQLAIALRAHLRKKSFFAFRTEPNLKKFLALVALGTIADVVPLTGQNRILVKAGLEVLSRSEEPGIVALKEVSQVKGKVSPVHVGYRLGPRLNAVGRLESAKLGFDLLVCQDRDEAQKLAQALDAANRERQQIEEQILEEAILKVQKELLPQKRKAILVFEPHWHIGVVGIVASRLAEKFCLPALVGCIEGDTVRCSARSIASLNLFEALGACKDQLLKFGGHHHAAGLTFKVQQATALQDNLDLFINEKLGEEDFIPRLKMDAKLQLSDIDEALMEQLSLLEPFGAGNPEPLFQLDEACVSSAQILQEKHLKILLKDGLRLVESIGFGMFQAYADLPQKISLAFQAQWNEWNGSRRIQLKLGDFPR
ncbi:MAG: single-stranded-DNA-specific exonuclease RecJ [Deltaproteobacteria bacterium]|nr:single-stranded-DNA-specific exonuclease RecJ [Deltaproteobacteria bacterium]